MDECHKNYPLSRPEFRALCTIWDTFMLENKLSQINFKNMCHCVGKKSSLLNLFYCTAPKTINGILNVSNILSEHDGVRITVDCKSKLCRPQ